MKLAILNDTHCGIRNSSDIFINYQEQFYEEVFFPYCVSEGITTILHAGDYYENRRFINFKALHANRKHFLNNLRKYGMHMDIILGNHDVYYKNTNGLNSLKELFGHYMNEVNIIVKPTVLEYGPQKIAMLPWITRDNEEESFKFINSVEADILLGHLELRGFEMNRGHTCSDGMDRSIFNRFPTVWSGHYHTKSIQDNIIYFGSQMEFTWSDAHDPKYFHVYDTETGMLDAIQNPLTLFEKIEYDDRKTTPTDLSRFENKFVKVVVIHKSDPQAFDMFLDRLQAIETHDLKVMEDYSEFVGENVDVLYAEDTEVLLGDYIDAVETSLDKERIKSQVRDLMTEAQSLQTA